VSAIHSVEQLLKLIALICAAVSAAILVWYLVKRPPLGRTTKVLLLLGLGLLPVLVALSGNIAGYEYTLKRPFCGSCHVMGPYLRDAEDPSSNSLAAVHSRNHRFGEESCYNCHADYKMFGAITTKLNGMRHLYMYITEFANTGPDGEGGPPIHIYKPFSNNTCMQCHSTKLASWMEKHPDPDSIRSGDMRCIDCHDVVHPLALTRRKKAAAAEQKPAGEKTEQKAENKAEGSK
jgi:cytochrome c-type protein NapC